ASFTARLDADWISALDAARHFASDDLRTALGEGVIRIECREPKATRVAERDGYLMSCAFDEPAGTTRVAAYFVGRGDLVYRLIFTWSSAYPRYARVVDAMVTGLRFEEPRALREARARALLFPNAPWALASLGGELRKDGEPHAAAEALRSAVRDSPSNVE